MIDIRGDFAIVLVPNVFEEGLERWDRYPLFVSQHVSLCTISRFSGLMGESGQTVRWRPFGSMGTCAGVF